VIALRIDFLAGRFHATPWGRAVNEGDVEWPPAPWRLLRAIVAAWLRSGNLDFQQLARICGNLAVPPRYDLPPATLGHTRHYLKQGTVRAGLQLDTSLVLDAFVAVVPGAEGVGSAYVMWDSYNLDEYDRNALSAALQHITYLGRAESWCELSLVDRTPAATHDRIHVGLRDLTDGEGPVVRRLGASPELRGSALLEQLLMTTAAMRGERRVTPLGTSWYDYKFPPHFGMDARDTAARERSVVQMPPRIERFILEGPAQSRYLRPSILETLTVAEAMRSAAMRNSSSRELRSADPLLSGKGPSGEPATGHGHAFFLPRDLDEDSHIDHVDVWFPRGSSNDTHRAVVSVRSLYDGRLDLPPNASYSLTHLGNADLVTATHWRSATPFVLDRHVKFTSRRSDEIKADGPEAQVRRSLQQHGFPEPISVEITDGVQLIGSSQRRKTRGDAFRRMRRRDTYAAPGFAVEISFSQAVCGPIVLGRYSHFGLGQFVPVASERAV